MKRLHFILFAITGLLLIFSSCREIKVTTKVNPDGTFTRIITVTGDSSDVFDTSLPFPVDESWLTASSKDPSDSTKFIQTYTRKFMDSDELNAEIKSDTGEYKNLVRDVSVTKKFRFFFSYLTFKEVYKSADPFKTLDYHDFLTEEELNLSGGLKTPVSPSDSLSKDEAKDKFIAFLVASATSEIESIIRDGMKRVNDPLLNTVDISNYHDSLYKLVDSWDDKSALNIIDSCSKWSGNNNFYLLNDLKPPLFEEFVKKIAVIDSVFELEGYTEEVEMPGLITGTNSAMLNGNLVSWEFQPMTILVRDFVMYSESRVINYWAFILAGIVLLAFLVLLVIKAAR